MKLPGYLEVVQKGWHSNCSTQDPFRCLDDLLRNVAREVHSWGQKKVGTIKAQIVVGREVLLHLDKAQDTRQLSEDEQQLRRELKRKCLGLASLERTIARARSRVTWLSDEDASTKFFHLQASYQRKKKLITKLQTPNCMAVTHEEKAEELFQQYNNIMGAEADRSTSST